SIFISSTYGPLRDTSLLDCNTPRTLGHNASSGIPLRAVLDGGTAKSQQPGRPTESNWGTPRIAQARQKQRPRISDCGCKQIRPLLQVCRNGQHRYQRENSCQKKPDVGVEVLSPRGKASLRPRKLLRNGRILGC